MLARFGCALCFLLPAAALAQTQQAPQADASSASRSTPAAQIRTGTQLVLVDVVVQDAAGKPVRHLPREAFHVTESKQPQTLAAFEEHSTANAPKPGPAIAPMPPGTFSDYTPMPESGALNVLLVDSLNTPLPGQGFLRGQLKDFVNKTKPGTRIAIFGLSSRLFLLQGFTSNLDALKAAVNGKLNPKPSSLMDNSSDGTPDTTMADAVAASGIPEAAANLQQFEALEQSDQMQLRIDATLDAFNALAHYLSAFPGRKNLLWFSGSFPINIFPDGSLDNPFSVMRTNNAEFRETTDLLAHAEIAVYPIDARGLTTSALLNPANSSSSQLTGSARTFSTAMINANASQFEDHATMEQLAAETGGHAYYNTNGLAQAATEAIETGSNFYTLAYTPTDRNQHGEYRPIHVELSGPQVAAGLKLIYRLGYYAEDSRRVLSAKEPNASSPHASTAAGFTPASADQAYRRAAMAHGGPAPQDILFKVRVLPLSTGTESQLAPGETADPGGAFKGPYRRYGVDFVALGSNIHLTPQPAGNYTGSVEFAAFVYNSDGKLLDVNSKTVAINLKPEDYKRLIGSGMNLHMLVSAPASGESYLRLAVHDVPANHYGVVEVSTASVSKLPPPPLPTPALPSPTATPR